MVTTFTALGVLLMAILALGPVAVELLPDPGSFPPARVRSSRPAIVPRRARPAPRALPVA